MTTETDPPPEPNRAEFLTVCGDRLRAAREKLGWSQREAAANAQVSRESLGGYERGEECPSFERIVQLAHAYGVSLDYLAGRSPHESGLPVGQAVLDGDTVAQALDAKSLSDLSPHLRDRRLVLGFEIPKNPVVVTDEALHSIQARVESAVEKLPSKSHHPRRPWRKPDTR